MVAIVVIGALAVAGVLIMLARSPGAPGAPGTPLAAATTCEDPCTEIRPRVDVTWTAPTDGGAVTGYRVERDGGPLAGAASIDPTRLGLIDDGVELGRTYTYRVIAFGEEGSSLPSSEVRGRVSVTPTSGRSIRPAPHRMWPAPRRGRHRAACSGPRGGVGEGRSRAPTPDVVAARRSPRRSPSTCGPSTPPPRAPSGGSIVHGRGVDPVRVPGVRAVDGHARGDRPQRMSALTGPRSRASA